jgi:hypothetical protein
MITLGIHDPVFTSSRTAKDFNEDIYCVVEVLSYPDTFTLFLSSAEGAIYCTFQIIVPSGHSATLFIQNADDARELSKQFDAIADILSGVTQ